jgi:hypothetical protein
MLTKILVFQENIIIHGQKEVKDMFQKSDKSIIMVILPGFASGIKDWLKKSNNLQVMQKCEIYETYLINRNN